jgi:hypothetical protein
MMDFTLENEITVPSLFAMLSSAFDKAGHDVPAPLLHEETPTTVDIAVASKNIRTPSPTVSKKKVHFHPKTIFKYKVVKPETVTPAEPDRRSDAVRALAARKSPPCMKVESHGGPGHDSGCGSYKKTNEGWQRSHGFKTGWQTVYGRAA